MTSQGSIFEITLNRAKKNKKTILFFAKVSVAVFLIIYIMETVNPSKLIESVKEADLTFIIFAFLLTFVNLSLQYKKWKITCYKFIGQCSDRKIISSLFAGISAGAFTPARVGEYFGRAIEFKDKPLIRITFATFIDKFYSLVIISFLGSASTILFLNSFYNIVNYLIITLSILAVIIFYFIFTFLIYPQKLNKLTDKFLLRSKRFKKIGEMISEYRSINIAFPLKMIFYSFLFCSCYILQFALLVIAFSHREHIIHFLWAGNMVMFVKSVIPSISLADLGIREGASIFFLGKMGESAVTAFNASIFLLLGNILFPAVIGLYFLFKKDGKSTFSGSKDV